MAGDELRIAVVTGGHTYDVRGFRDLFRGLPGIVADVQHLEDFASSDREVRTSYDAVAFYGMMEETPRDEGLPWYAGKPLTALRELGETAQGIVVLHHALLAYAHWPHWDEIVGIRGRREGFRYRPNCMLRIDLARDDHPITEGLTAWDLVDETYVIPEPGKGSEILLTTDHPDSMHAIAWVRTFGQARVFCYQSGHDAVAYQQARFQEVLARGIRWTAEG